MSILNVLPTLNCVYIGLPDRPLNAPRHTPGRILNYVAQVAALTEPTEIRWQLEPPTECWSNPAPAVDPLNRRDGSTVTCSADGVWGQAADPARLRQRLRRGFDGAMRGRALHVVPFAGGDRLGILVTDQPAVVAAVAAIATVGEGPLSRIAAGRQWQTVVHCLGGDDQESYLVRFAESGETWAYGPDHHATTLLDLRLLTPAAD